MKARPEYEEDEHKLMRCQDACGRFKSNEDIEVEGHEADIRFVDSIDTSPTLMIGGVWKSIRGGEIQILYRREEQAGFLEAGTTPCRVLLSRI